MLTKIVCRAIDCIFNENKVCTSEEIVYDPDEGCLTYEALDDLVAEEVEDDLEDEELVDDDLEWDEEEEDDLLLDDDVDDEDDLDEVEFGVEDLELDDD